MGKVRHKILMLFPASVVEEPMLYHLVKDYDLLVNVLKANINPRKEGSLVMEVAGEQENYRAGIAYIESKGVRILPFEEQICWNEKRCTQCGACTVICPTDALEMVRPQMEVKFNGDKCIVCGHCLKACPARAVEVHY